MADWYRDNIDMVEVLVHVDPLHIGATAERFIVRNGPSILDVLDRCVEFGLDVLIAVDWHYGNGRRQQPGEPGSDVRFGDYHYASAEGGVIPAVQRVVKWAADYPIVAIKIGNEQSAPDSWYEGVCERAKQVMGDKIKLVVGGSRSNMVAGAPYADVIGPHLLFSTWRDELDHALRLAARSGGIEVWPLEMIAIRGQDAATYLEMIAFLTGFVSCFSGNTTEDDGTEWPTGRVRKPQLTLHSNAGRNSYGDTWARLFGDAQPAPPPEVDVPAAIRVINRQVEKGRSGWVRLNRRDQPSKTVRNLLARLGVAE
jgi:hypothetical protein